MVYQSHSECLFCIDQISRHEKFERPAFSNQSRKALRSTVSGDNAQVDFRLTKFGLATCQPHMAGHGEFASSPQGETIHRCDHRFWAVFDHLEQLLTAFSKGKSLIRA